MTSQFPKIGAFCRVRVFALFASMRVKGLGQRWKRIRGLRGRLEPIQIQHSGDGAGSLAMRSVPEGRPNWGFASTDKDRFFEQDTEPLIGRNRKYCRGNNHS